MCSRFLQTGLCGSRIWFCSRSCIGSRVGSCVHTCIGSLIDGAEKGRWNFLGSRREYDRRLHQPVCVPTIFAQMHTSLRVSTVKVRRLRPALDRFRFTNRYRCKHGAKALKWDNTLAADTHKHFGKALAPQPKVKQTLGNRMRAQRPQSVTDLHNEDEEGRHQRCRDELAAG